MIVRGLICIIPVSIRCSAGWTSELVWTRWRRQKYPFLVPARKWT